MKDIKTLYLTARSSGKQTDIAAYTEAINDLLKTDPYSYLSNLEYIISSSIGLDTWDSFVAENGFPLACYNDIVACFEKCIDKCDKCDKDASKYREAKEKLESFYDSHKHCVSMYESYSSNIMRDGKSYGEHITQLYVETYYGFNGSGIQNRKLVSGMIKTFGEYAVPDMLITAESIGKSAVDTALSFIESAEKYASPIFYQYVTEAAKDIVDNSNKHVVTLESKSVQNMVDNIMKRNQMLIRESVLMGYDNPSPRYTIEDVQLIRDLIEYKESQIVSGLCDIELTQKEVYSLYESIDGIIEEDGEYNQSFLYEAVTEEQKAALKQMSTRLTDICKSVKKAVRKDIKEAVKSFNKINDLKFRERVLRPSVQIVVGTDKYRGKPLRGSRLDEKLKEEIKIDKKYLKGICLYAIFKMESGHQLTSDQKNDARDVYVKSLIKVLSPMIRNGQLSILKPDKCYTYYTTYVSTLTLPIYIAKSAVMKDIPASLFESVFSDSLIEGCIVESLIEDFDDSGIDVIAPMMPDLYNEAKWIVNTRNKKTGAIPTYLGSNHDIGYGEDDVVPSGSSPSEDELKRPSADDAEDDTTAPDTVLDPEPEEQAAASADAQQQAVNNYYYYTYNNSMNKNTHSFNKDNSSRDNHSNTDNSIHVSSRDNHSRDDHSSVRRNDDHSTGKRSHSNDYYAGTQEEDEGDETPSEHTEAAGLTLSLTEGFLDRFKGDKKDPQPSSTVKYVQISEEDIMELTNRVKKLEADIVSSVEPLLKTYPVYGLTVSLADGELEDFINEFSRFESESGYKYSARIINGTLDIETPRIEVGGYDQHDFMNKLMKDHPEEIERLKRIEVFNTKTNNMNPKYDLNSRYSWSEIHWSQKICGYDKNLEEICDTIGEHIMKFHLVGEFEFGGDNDSGPEYSNKISASYLLNGLKSFENIPLTEARDVGDYMDSKPQSDSPMRDIALDIDRKMQDTNQQVKSGIQKVQNVGRAAMKPVNRAKDWVTKAVWDWKDKDENAIKERLADPKTRSNLFSAIKTAIKTGSLAKAGLLFNPIFLFLGATKAIGKNKNEYRLRNEMIGELKTEIEIIDEKIKDANNNNDNAAKYKLMRFKNELQKKYLRVGGGPKGSWAKVI